jgi:hypothetical protein
VSKSAAETKACALAKGISAPPKYTDAGVPIPP